MLTLMFMILFLIFIGAISSLIVFPFLAVIASCLRRRFVG